MVSGTYALDTTWRVLLRDLGISPERVLRRAGLAQDLFEHASTRLAPEQYYRLWEAVAAEHGDPLFPIRLCQSIRTESFSPPLFAAMCSPNLLVAAQRVARYKKLVAPLHMEVREAPDAVTIEFTWPAGPLQPPVGFVTMELMFCVALARMGTREPIRPLEVSTTVLPTPSAPYEEFLGAPLRRAQAHRVRFDRADATRPFLTANDMMWSAFEPGLRQRLADLQSAEQIATRVRAALLEAIPSGRTHMEEIAGQLAMSKRTLQRRIEREGTSFQQLLNETREALARHYLRNTKLPAAEISFLLGFEEPNSFHRAFRNWTGKTPESLRSA